MFILTDTVNRETLVYVYATEDEAKASMEAKYLQYLDRLNLDKQETEELELAELNGSSAWITYDDYDVDLDIHEVKEAQAWTTQTLYNIHA